MNSRRNFLPFTYPAACPTLPWWDTLDQRGLVLGLQGALTGSGMTRLAGEFTGKFVYPV